MSRYVGVIAEDQSDVDVLKSLVERMSSRRLKFRQRVGHGCGRIKSECLEWGEDLYLRGCRFLIVAQDADTNSPDNLRQTLERALSSSSIPVRAVVVPVQEIEAWLLADEQAIRRVFKLPRTPDRVRDLEQISKPKERLGEIVSTASEGTRIYVHTLHNAKIAAELRLTRLRACQSYSPFRNFVQEFL